MIPLTEASSTLDWEIGDVPASGRRATLGTLAPQDLANAIALGNWQMIEQTPGVGKKLAQRIVLELKDKAPALTVAGLNVSAGKPGVGGKSAPAAAPSAAAEAISALSNLGYNPAQASGAVAVAMKELGDDADTARLIRRGLRELAR